MTRLRLAVRTRQVCLTDVYLPSDSSYKPAHQIARGPSQCGLQRIQGSVLGGRTPAMEAGFLGCGMWSLLVEQVQLCRLDSRPHLKHMRDGNLYCMTSLFVKVRSRRLTATVAFRSQVGVLNGSSVCSSQTNRGACSLSTAWQFPLFVFSCVVCVGSVDFHIL